MLDTIHEYANELLRASDEPEATRRAHAAYFLSLAEQAEPELTGSRQAEWLQRLHDERGNLRAVLRWARDTGEGEIGLRLAGAVWRYWYTRGYLSEGRSWLDELLALPASAHAPAGVRAKALHGAATLASTQDDVGRAAVLGEESLALARASGDRALTASVLNSLGLAALQSGDVERAAPLFVESLALARAVGEPWNIGRTLHSLAQTRYIQGAYTEARALFEECLALMRQAGSGSHIAVTLLYLGHVSRAQGDLEEAARLYRESLALAHDVGDRLRVIRALEGLAVTAAEQGEPKLGVRLLGATAAVREHLGAARHPMDRATVEQVTDELRSELGEDEFAAAWAAGFALSPEEVIAEVQQGLS
jgi:tetratricopeptide (TPR) repeat protein